MHMIVQHFVHGMHHWQKSVEKMVIQLNSGEMRNSVVSENLHLLIEISLLFSQHYHAKRMKNINPVEHYVKRHAKMFWVHHQRNVTMIHAMKVAIVRKVML